MWEAIRWLHLLAMAFFVGGQLFLVACVVPVVRDDRPRIPGVVRRFGGVWLGVALAHEMTEAT
jgi:putative copper export protein